MDEEEKVFVEGRDLGASADRRDDGEDDGREGRAGSGDARDGRVGRVGRGAEESREVNRRNGRLQVKLHTVPSAYTRRLKACV